MKDKQKLMHSIEERMEHLTESQVRLIYYFTYGLHADGEERDE